MDPRITLLQNLCTELLARGDEETISVLAFIAAAYFGTAETVAMLDRIIARRKP